MPSKPRFALPSSRSRCLWDDAFDNVASSGSDQDVKNFTNNVRESIKQYSTTSIGRQNPVSPELEVCRDVLQIAQSQQLRYEEKRWSISSSRKIDVGEVYGQVATCVQKFVGVGDSIAQFDPVHFALPWAAVRFILTVRVLEATCPNTDYDIIDLHCEL